MNPTRILPLLLMLTAPLAVIAQNYVASLFSVAVPNCTLRQTNDDKPYLTKSFSPEGLTAVRVETSGGNVALYGQASGEARIEVYIRGNDWKNTLSDAEIKERLRKYEIAIDKDANTLKATAKRLGDADSWKNWGWKEGLSISFKIYVPANITSDLRTSGGNIRLSGLNGSQTARTSGGNIDFANTKGTADLRTSGGNIGIENFSGTLEAQTSGGNVKAEDAQGTLKLGTSGGGIRLERVAGSLEAHTSGGNVSADIARIDKQLTLTTSGGNISVKMPLDKGMDLDLSGDRVSISMQQFEGTIKDERVKGKLNGGGIPVRLSTSGGNVRVN